MFKSHAISTSLQYTRKLLLNSIWTVLKWTLATKVKASLQSDFLLIPVIDDIHNSQFIPSNGKVLSPTEYFSFSANVERMGIEAAKASCQSPACWTAFERKYHGFLPKL